MPAIVLISGPLAVGKTAVARALIDKHNFARISSSGYLRELATSLAIPTTRVGLQELGDRLDTQTDFAWVVDAAAAQIESEPLRQNWFVDAVRKSEQVRNFRNKFRNLIHVHLTAAEGVLKTRFLQRARNGDATTIIGSYENCIAHPNEVSARALGEIADLSIDLGEVEPSRAADLIERSLIGRE
jgi:cytidylate kinase